MPGTLVIIFAMIESPQSMGVYITFVFCRRTGEQEPSADGGKELSILLYRLRYLLILQSGASAAVIQICGLKAVGPITKV